MLSTWKSRIVALTIAGLGVAGVVATAGCNGTPQSSHDVGTVTIDNYGLARSEPRIIYTATPQTKLYIHITAPHRFQRAEATLVAVPMSGGSVIDSDAHRFKQMSGSQYSETTISPVVQDGSYKLYVDGHDTSLQIDVEQG